MSPLPESKDLRRWLDRLEQMQPDRIELGLERMTRVAATCELLNPSFRIITVAGTNGKGSTVAYTANILMNSAMRVGIYTSPHFIEFNERIVIDQQRIDDALLCEAFALIDARRNGTELTYFEFTTLAAMVAFCRAEVDVAVLEVGLGGRLDAVNTWDCDVGCVTSIGIDHIDWLGDDRESIGREKAGIARAGKALICGDANPPSTIALVAAEVGAVLLETGHDFHYRCDDAGWQYRGPHASVELPLPQITGEWAVGNASVAITACAELLNRLPDTCAVTRALQSVSVPGRMQQLHYRGVPMLLDVAHNPQAAAALARHLQQQPQHTVAVFSCMQDKDAGAVIAELAEQIHQWQVVQLDYPRAIDAQLLLEMINKQSPAGAEVFTSVIQAVESAVAQSTVESRIVVFGSFHVVGPVLELLESSQ
ncbi:MAG: bifunctional tetrahydrofolate synthase/dihydrofolate synthase [Pseudomonadota bacterium]